MNKSILSVLLLIGLYSLLSACNKSTTTPTPVGTMNALVTANQWESGSTWSCKNTTATLAYENTPSGYTKVLGIGGVKTSGVAQYGFIGFIITNYHDSANTFVLDQTNNVGTYLTIIGTDTTVHIISYGQLIITSGTAKAAQGYFSFTCKDSTKITNGVFNVVMQ